MPHRRLAAFGPMTSPARQRDLQRKLYSIEFLRMLKVWGSMAKPWTLTGGLCSRVSGLGFEGFFGTVGFWPWKFLGFTRLGLGAMDILFGHMEPELW